MFYLPKSHGVLGINARNLKYLRPFNPDKVVAFADDKLKTKVFLETRGIPVPKLYAKITNRDELREFDFSIIPDECALKPNFGYGGEGILVLKKREKDGWRTASGRLVSYQEVFEHCENILDGMYSLNHRRDTAFFEQLITPSDDFASLNPAGLPDIRILVFNLVPVMAMMRLPTDESEGKANVHLGGVGLGIDIAKGVTTFGVQHNKRISNLPNGRETGGFKIPKWDEMLLISSQIQQMTNIGFLGVDLTIDKDMGPVLLEVNARAGLMVQIANLAPLGKRLERVKGLKVSSPEKGVRMAQDLFGEKVITKEEKEAKQERPVLATREVIEILGGKKQIKVPAVLRPDYDRTVFDPSLVRELTKLKAIEEDKDGTYRVKFSLGGKKLQTVVRSLEIREDDPAVRASIGKRDLAGYLVDPGKKPQSPIHISTDLSRIDKQLADIDRKIQLMKHIRPSNLEEERARVEDDPSHNPVFTYEKLSFDPKEFRDRLKYLEADYSPVGRLLKKKRDELLLKIDLLESRGDNLGFMEASKKLYGDVTQSLLGEARGALRPWQGHKKSKKLHDQQMFSAEEVCERLMKAIREYGLREWDVQLNPDAVADCFVGREKIHLRAGALFSEERVLSLIAHEIEVHVFTRENGKRQPYELFERGMAGYLETQEGLAVWNERRVLSEWNEKRFWPALHILAINYGKKHSFSELVRYVRRLGFDNACALRTALKIKRGLGDTSQKGAFTKELVYFKGVRRVTRYLESGGDLKKLFIGKLNIEDIDLVDKVDQLVDPVYCISA